MITLTLITLTAIILTGAIITGQYLAIRNLEEVNAHNLQTICYQSQTINLQSNRIAELEENYARLHRIALSTIDLRISQN